MSTIPANELKTKGVSAIENALKGSEEVILSVRGRDKYVVMSFEHYTHLRTCELEAALHAARSDVQSGKGWIETPEEHVRRLDAME